MNQSKSSYLNGHFDRWWAEQHRLWGEAAPQKEQAVQDVFNILACALGPLKREELLALIGESAEPGLRLEDVLHIVSPFVTGDGETQGYVISDPQMREHLYNQLTEDERLIREGRFLDWGRRISKDLEVGKLSPEVAPAYVVQYYGTHMERSGGSEDDIFSLVSDNWRRAWIALEGAYTGFLEDVERAWRAAVEIDRNEVEKDNPAPQFGMEVRCALCKSSVVSLASEIPPVLLGALVEKKVWTPAQALTYTLSLPEGKRNFDIFAPHLTEELLRQALLATLAIEDWQIQAHYLIELVPYLPEAMLRDALGVIEKDLENWALWGKLRELAPHLSGEMLGEILVAVQGIGDWKARADALVGLAPHLSDKQLQETLVTARALENTGAQAFVLVKMIPHLPEVDRAGFLAEALEAARSAESYQYRVSTLTEVIRYLPEAKRDEILLEALVAASELEEEVFRLIALVELAPYITEPLAKKFLAVLRDFKISLNQAHALDKMAPYLPESALREALATVKAIEDKTQRADALASLAPHMPETLLRESLKEALAIDKKWIYREATAKLIPHLSEKLLREALVAAQELEEENSKEYTLAALALRFAEIGYPQEAYRLMREAEGTWAWVKVLSGLAPHLPNAQFREMLAAARAIEGNWRRAEALTRLAPHVPEVKRAEVLQEVLATMRVPDELIPLLPETLLQQALEIAQELDDKDEQLVMRTALAIQLAEIGNSQKALSIIDAIDNDEGRAIGLVELVTHLPESERSEILTNAMCVARKIESRWTRAHLLAELAQSLPQLERDEVLHEAYAAALEIEVEMDREDTLAWLASLLPESLVREVLKAGQVVEYDSYVLSCLAQRLGELGFPDEGLTLAKEIEDDVSCTEAIAGLAPHLSEALLSEALAVVNAIGDDRSRAIGLAGLANYLPDDESIAVFQEALDAVQLISVEPERASALSDLAQYLSEVTLNQFLTAVNTIKDDFRKEMALDSLASRFCELGRHEDALKIAQTLENDWARAEILAKIAPDLSEELLIETLTLAKEIRYIGAGGRRETFDGLAPELAKLPRLQLFELWQETLPVLAAYPRGELLKDLSALMPVITELGGPEGLAEIAHVAEDVGEWWP
ncbi:MAG: hypothetical protein V3S76_01500 [Candidatus Bipolaricaulota bacterium]